MDKYLVGFLIAVLLGAAVDVAQRALVRNWVALALGLFVQAGLSVGLLIALGRYGERPQGGDALAAAASVVMLLGFLALVLIANAVLGAIRLRRRKAAEAGAADLTVRDPTRDR